MDSKFYRRGNQTSSESSDGANPSLEHSHSSDDEQVTHNSWSKGLAIEIDKFPYRNIHEETSSAPSSVERYTNQSRYKTCFKQLDRLGRGSFGVVYRCINLMEGREYAIKKIALTRESDTEKICREVKALASLPHSHIVRYYQAWTDEDVAWLETEDKDLQLTRGKKATSTLYIQMELYPKTLANQLKGNSKEEAWRFFRQIVEGLCHIHQSNIIHRDLSRRNIFLDAANNIKIGDFGLAKFITDGSGSPVTISGTPDQGNSTYRAPEMAGEKPQISNKVDIYSLGWVFLDLFVSFPSKPERDLAHEDIIERGIYPKSLTELELSLFREMISTLPQDRPSAADILLKKLPWLNPIEKELEEKNALIEDQRKTIVELKKTIEVMLAKAEVQKNPHGGTMMRFM